MRVNGMGVGNGIGSEKTGCSVGLGRIKAWDKGAGIQDRAAPFVMRSHEGRLVEAALAGGHGDRTLGGDQLDHDFHCFGTGPVVALPRQDDLLFNTGGDHAFQPTAFGLHFLLLLFVASSLEPICCWFAAWFWRAECPAGEFTLWWGSDLGELSLRISV